MTLRRACVKVKSANLLVLVCLILFLTVMAVPAGAVEEVRNATSNVSAIEWLNPENACTSDNNYASTSGNAGNGKNITYWGYGYSIPLGFSIDEVLVGVEYYTNDVPNYDDYLGVQVTWDGGGTWSLEQAVTLQNSDPNTPQWLNFSSAVNWTPQMLTNTNFKVIVWARLSGAPAKKGPVYLDWLPVKVTYSPTTLPFVYWNLTNGTDDALPSGSNVYRSDTVNASAYWNVTGSIDTAIVNHNGNGSFVNYTIPGPYAANWTNYTFDFYNTNYFPKAGLVNVSSIYANDTYGISNMTSPARYFYLWSEANVSASYANASIIYNETTASLHCRVIDGFSGDALENYNVSFYNTTTNAYIGSDLTNATGWASINYQDGTGIAPLTFNITCNITDQANLYYNDSATNARNITIQAVDPWLVAAVATTPVNFGQNVTIIANVSDNATAVTRVWANVSYYNLSSIADEWEEIDLSLNQAFSNLKHEYRVSYNPKRSGRYNVSIKAEAGARNATNTTNFDVNFGRPVIEFTYPNYRVLNNQSFNITVNITALDGDLWRTNFTLNITREDKLNITPSDYWLRADHNLTNGTVMVVNWSATSKATGYLRIALNATPQNGTRNETSIPISVVLPYLNITPATLNVTDTASIRTSVIGNATAINGVNLTVEKQYTTDIERSTAALTSIAQEETCSGAVTGAGNVALAANGGSATCTGFGCGSSIDGSIDTPWLAGSLGDWLTITFNTTYAIDQLKFYWYNVSNPTKISIYYERDGAWTPLMENQTSPSTPEWTNYTELTPFETRRIKINLSTASTLALYEFRAITVAKRESKCYVYDHSYTNTTLSGNYTVNTSAVTENVTKQASTFFANFGTPLIDINMVSALLEGQNNNKTYWATISASGGDLRNLSVNLTIADEDVLNITAGEDNPQNISVIFAGQGRTLNWTVNGNMTGITNTTIEANSTTEEGAYNSTNKTVEVFSSDFIPPVINTFWFEYKGVRTNMTNLRTTYTIFANITDNRAVESAKANITYPDGQSLNASMTLYSGTDKDGIWNFTFENAGVFLNQTGKYEIRISAQDIKPNEEIGTVVNNFTAYANYTLNATTSYSSYNRGEAITLRVWDVNDNLVEDLNWTVNLTRYNQSETNIYAPSNATNTTFTYVIASGDPRGNYTLFANASKLGNSGNTTLLFNVSALIDVNVSFPPQDTTYATSTTIDNPKVRVYSARSVEIVDANVSAYCLNQSQVLASSNMSYGITYSGYYSFGFLDVKCYSPSSYSTRFNVTINAVDVYNNTGAINLTLLTQGRPSTPAAGGGGGGGVRQIVNITEIREVTIELALPSYSPTEEQKVLLFQSPGQFELVRGRNESFLLSITNPFPNATIENLTVKVEGYLADYISLAPVTEPLTGYRGFTVERAIPAERKAYLVAYNQTQNFRLSLAAPTYIERGTYPLKFTISGVVAYYDYPTSISNETGEVKARKNVTLEMLETRIINLMVYEISREEAAEALKAAESDFREVLEVGFPSKRIEKLVEEVRESLEKREYGRARVLSEEVAEIRQSAFVARGLIADMEQKIAEAEERGLKVIETRELFNLVLAAFEREDFATAQKRIQDAQLVYSVETEGKVNWAKVFFDYWEAISAALIFAFISGVVGYRRMTVVMIGRKLDSLYVEEEKLNELMKEAQQKFYHARTMSMSVYNKTVHQYENRLSELNQERARLRAKRVGLLRASGEYENLKKEDERLIQLMKDAQNSYFNDRTITRSAYLKSMENYKRRKAEVEEGLTMLEAKLIKKHKEAEK